MAEDPEIIRAQMERTRASLTEKLEALENQVVGTVQEATSAVAETVETIKEAAQETVGTVKETVHETVDTVRQTFDLKLQFQRRPLLVMGGSALLGYLAGSIMPRSRGQRSSPEFPAVCGYDSAAQEPVRARKEAEYSSPPPPRNGLGHKLSEALQPEMEKLKGIAIGALIGVVRDMTVKSVGGELGDQLRETFDDITDRLGGKTFKHPLISEPERDSPNRRAAPPGRAEGLRRF